MEKDFRILKQYFRKKQVREMKIKMAGKRKVTASLFQYLKVIRKIEKSMDI